MTIGVGILGCGLIGEKRAAQLPTAMQLVRCFDLDAERAAAVAGAYGAASLTTSSVDELLADPRIDLVVVAVVHRDLAALARLAVEAGKHVLLEKPGGTSPGELRPVAAAAAACGLCVRVGYNHRFHPSLREVGSAVRSGRHGRLLFVRARYGHGGRLGYEREWRADRQMSGGGELVDQGSHLVDLVRWLFGDVELAFAELPTAFWAMGVEDNAFLALRPRSGGFAWLHASWTEWKNLFSFEVMLERAKLEVSGLGGSYGAERLLTYEMAPEFGPPPIASHEWPPGDGSWGLELEDVAAALRGEPADGATLDDAIATLTLIEEAYSR